jgi:transcriptional regulator with XRE-family HTH domain
LQLVRRAIDEATLGVADLAESIGYDRTTLARWRDGSRWPTGAALRALGRVLRRRGRRLLELADRLEAEAEKEERS